MKKSVVNVVYVGLIVVGVLIVVLGGFLWFSDGEQQDDVMRVSDVARVELVILPGDVENFDGGVENEFDDVVGEDCVLTQVQYSLKDFQKNVSCLESEGVECLTTKVSCSAEVYNFDEGVDDIFKIGYSLVDLDGEELDFKLVEKNVGVGNSEFFSVEFVLDNDEVGGDLDCVFGVVTIPQKSVC